MKSAVQIWPISNSIIVVIYFKYNKILVSTKTLLTSNKELRIVTVVTVQFYRLGVVSRYRIHLSGKYQRGLGWIHVLFGQIWPTDRKVRVISDKRSKFCLDKNRGRKISGSNIYASGDYQGALNWPVSMSKPSRFAHRRIGHQSRVSILVSCAVFTGI